MGMIPLINHDSRVRENSEVVIIYLDGGSPNSWMVFLMFSFFFAKITWMIIDDWACIIMSLSNNVLILLSLLL